MYIIGLSANPVTRPGFRGYRGRIICRRIDAGMMYIRVVQKGLPPKNVCHKPIFRVSCKSSRKLNILHLITIIRLIVTKHVRIGAHMSIAIHEKVVLVKSTQANSIQVNSTQLNKKRRNSFIRDAPSGAFMNISL